LRLPATALNRIMRRVRARHAIDYLAMLAVVACATQTSPAASLSATPDSATARAVLTARDAIWRAWFANDTAQLRLLLPESVAAGEENGPSQRWTDRRQILSDAARFVSAGGTLSTLEFPATEIQMMGDVAVVYSTYHVETTMHGSSQTLQGHSTEIFVLRDGRWINPFWHLGP
jgi:hypothetical protein